MSRVLITGGAGFVGTNTADRLLSDGQPVRILDDLSRPGVEQNLRWLEQRHGSLLEAEIGDVREPERLQRTVKGVDHVFHFAAQVAVTTSFEDPLRDAAANLQGTLNLLEAVRHRPRPPSLLFTSTNKVYGGLEDLELVEDAARYRPAEPRWRPAVSARRALCISARRTAAPREPPTNTCSTGTRASACRPWSSG
jgi:CDP-paratose 2-epimerase